MQQRSFTFFSESHAVDEVKGDPFILQNCQRSLFKPEECEQYEITSDVKNNVVTVTMETEPITAGRASF